MTTVILGSRYRCNQERSINQQSSCQCIKRKQKKNCPQLISIIFFSAILKRKLCRKLSECLFYTKYKRALIIISVLTDEGVRREAKFVPFIVEVTLRYEKSAIITLYGGHLHYQHS